jgi:endonuclease/exonuclease/phosphatase family metal-dependent hydrolase
MGMSAVESLTREQQVKMLMNCVVLYLAAVSGVAYAGWAKISVVTYNIHSGTNEFGAPSINGIASALNALGADVIALQEVSVKWEPPCGDNFWDLSTLLSSYTYRVYEPSDTQPGDIFKCGWSQQRKTGNAIFSRWPIIEQWKLTLPTTWTKRNAIGVRVQRGTQQFIVYATHLQNDSEGTTRAADRLAQAQAIASDVAARGISGLPIFVMGDFNAGSTWPELQPLRDVAWGPHAPIAPFADSGIDFGFFRPYNPSVSETLFATAPGQGSDHPGPVRLDWWYWSN